MQDLIEEQWIMGTKKQSKIFIHLFLFVVKEINRPTISTSFNEIMTNMVHII